MPLSRLLGLTATVLAVAACQAPVTTKDGTQEPHARAAPAATATEQANAEDEAKRLRVVAQPPPRAPAAKLAYSDNVKTSGGRIWSTWPDEKVDDPSERLRALIAKSAQKSGMIEAVTLGTTVPPRVLTVSAWREVSPQAGPKHEIVLVDCWYAAVSLPPECSFDVQSGHVKLSLPEFQREQYELLTVYASWPDATGRGVTTKDASWAWIL